MLPLILPPAMKELGRDVPLWMFFYLPALAGGVFGLLGGYLTDRFGRKKLFMVTLGVYLVFTVATASCSRPRRRSSAISLWWF